MQDIGIATSRPALVDRPEGSQTVYLEFRGTRDARAAVDRDTRIRISMPAARAEELRGQLAAVVPPHLEWRAGVLEILDQHHGETGVPEDALEVVLRLSKAWRESHPA